MVSKLLKTLSIFVLAFFIVPGTSIKVAANTGLMVQGTRLVANVKPGDKLIHKITLTIGSDDPTTDVNLSINDLSLTPEGLAVPREEEETGPTSAVKFIKLDRTSLHLEPGKPQSVTATIQVPSQAGAGGRYALISIKTLPLGSGNIGVISAVNIPVYLTLEGTELIHIGTISGITTGNIANAKPIEIETTFENSGNHHFKVDNEVSISDHNGKVLCKLNAGPTPSSLIPGSSRVLRVRFMPKEPLSPGEYKVISTVKLEDGTVLDKSTGSFEVKAEIEPALPSQEEQVLPGGNYLSQGEVITESSAPQNSIQTIPSVQTTQEQPQLNTFLMDTLRISPALVRPGQPVMISIPVTNLGHTDSNLELTFNMNGAAVEKKSLALKAGETRTAYFVTGQKEPGSYTIEVSGLTGEFQVSGAPVRNWTCWWAGGVVALGVGAACLFAARRFRR